MATIQWVEGDTSQRIFTLTQQGVAFDLTGAVVEAIVRPAGNASVPRTYAAVVVSAAEGKIGVSLNALKVTESPYGARFRVTKAGVTSYFPFPAADSWEVLL